MTPLYPAGHTQSTRHDRNDNSDDALPYQIFGLLALAWGALVVYWQGGGGWLTGR